MRLILALTLLASPLLGWWDAGHLTIALIAKEHLDPAALRQVDAILSASFDGRTGEDPFLQASVWPDLLKERGLKALDAWHYVDTPEAPAPGDAVSICGQCLRTLQDPKAGPWEKAFMLRWLIHLVGDLHQPLHCASLRDARFPAGDRGGTLFPLDSKETPNLHALWDAGLGLLPALRYADYRRDGARARQLRALAKDLQRSCPRADLDLGGDAKAWALESARLAREVAYAGIQPGQAPDPAYLAKGRQVVARQVTLAGYRLAGLLNDLYGGGKPASRPRASW